MSASLLVDVRSAIIAGLAADATVLAAVNDATHEVKFAFQWKQDESVREWVFTGDARFTHTSAAMKAGRNFRNEAGRFNLIVLVAGVDLSQEEASTRCLAIASACADWIGDHKNGEGLGVDGLQTLTIDGDGALDEFYADTGHIATVDLPIKFTARLT